MQAQCLREGCLASPWSSRSPFRVRSCTTAMAGSNYTAEQSFLHLRGDAWVGLHFPCNMHIIARIMKRSFTMMDRHISGMLHLALSLSVGGVMLRFREALVWRGGKSGAWQSRHLHRQPCHQQQQGESLAPKLWELSLLVSGLANLQGHLIKPGKLHE